MAVIRQMYYSTTFVPNASGTAGIWPTAVTADDLIKYCGAGNPPLYIDSVSYGRFLCLTVTGSASTFDITAAVKARWAATVSGNVAVDVNTKKLLDACSVQIYTIGVPGQGGFQTLDTPEADLNAVFKTGLMLNRSNPGAPVAFTVRHILDNTLAHVGLAAMYVQPLGAVGEDAVNDFPVWDGPGGGLVDTGIAVNPGDRLLIHASGQIWSGVWLTGTNGPEGWPGWTANSAAPVPQGSANSLVARVGGQPWFEAGGHWEGTVPVGADAAGGNLQLNVNDNNPYNGDAKKQWCVHVEVRRKGAGAAGVYV